MFGNAHLSGKYLSKLFGVWKLLSDVMMFEVVLNTAVKWAV
jgi:hypothetical protein